MQKIKCIWIKVDSLINKWVRSSFARISSGSGSKWTCQWVNRHFDVTGLSLIIEGKFNVVFLIWNSAAVNSEAVESIQLRGLSLGAIYWGNGSWIREFSFNEVLHFILVSKSEGLVGFQNDENVVNVGVDITDDLYPFIGISVYRWGDWSLYLASTWTSVSIDCISIITCLSFLDSAISADGWAVILTDRWLSSTGPKRFNSTSWWASIIVGFVLVITLLPSNNESISTGCLANTANDWEASLDTAGTNCSTWAGFAPVWTCYTPLIAVKERSCITSNWGKDNLFTNSISVKI